MPDEDLLLDGAKHDENQSHCGKLCKDTESYAQCSRHFRYSKKNGKALTHTDTFASLIGLRNVTPAAGDEDQADHESEGKQTEVGKLSELRKHVVATRNVVLTATRFC